MTTKKVKIELSKSEASYLRGMLEAYISSLHIDKHSGSDLILKEIRTADRIGRKIALA